MANSNMKIMSFSVPTDMEDALTAQADDEEISRSKLLRRYVRAGLGRRAKKDSELRQLREEVQRLSGLIEKLLRKRR